jgi:hypothetical protein
MSDQLVLGGRVINADFKIASLLANGPFVFNVMAASLVTFAAALMLMHAMSPFAMPATDLDFLVLAHG